MLFLVRAKPTPIQVYMYRYIVGALELQVACWKMQVWKSEVQSGKMCTGGKYKYGKLKYK